MYQMQIYLVSLLLCVCAQSAVGLRPLGVQCKSSQCTQRLYSISVDDAARINSNLYTPPSGITLPGLSDLEQSSGLWSIPSAEAPKTDDGGLWQSRILLLTVSALYGTNFGCVKILGEAMDPSVAAALRFLVAFIVFSPNLVKVVKANPLLVLGGLEVGVYNSLAYWAQANALSSSPASVVGFICSLQVVVVPMINAMSKSRGGGSKDNKVRSFGDSFLPALLAAAGVGCLELGGSRLPGTGDLWALLQPLLFGVAFYRVEKHMEKCDDPGDAAGFTAASLALVAVFSIVWGLHDFALPLYNAGGVALSEALQGQYNAIVSDWRVPAALLWTGVVTTACCCWAENVAMQKLDAEESTVLFSTEPLWSTAFAATALGETVGWNTAVGAVLIIAACTYTSFSARLLGAGTAASVLLMDGLEVVGENVGVNFAKLLESGFMDPLDVPEL
jgi:drug/metabolite transporter (DMT)-like permease